MRLRFLAVAAIIGVFIGGTIFPGLQAVASPDSQVQQWPFASVFSLPIEAQRGITVGSTTNNPNPTNMLDVTGSASISTSLSVGSAPGTATPAALTGVYTGTGTWNPGALTGTPGVLVAATVTVNNAAGGDNTTASFGSLTTASGTPIASNGVVVTGAITAPNTCTVVIQNYTGAALDLDSGTVRCTVFKY